MLQGASAPEYRDVARPVAAALGVVLHGGRVLLVRRANPPDAGLWGFPGGKIEPGETITVAAVREIREETGIEAAARMVFDAVDAFDHDGAGRLRRQFVLIAVLCDWRGGAPFAGDDALEAAWFTPAEMALLEMSAGVAEMAQQAERLLRSSA